MAGSRVEKLFTIFKRYTGLIKSGAVLAENRPLWYDVYEHFPPSVEPLAIREQPKVAISNIYYPEDILRSRFFRTYDDSSTVFNFVSSSSSNQSACEMFIGKYLQLAKQTGSPGESINLNDEALFSQTEAALRTDHGLKLRRRKDGERR